MSPTRPLLLVDAGAAAVALPLDGVVETLRPPPCTRGAELPAFVLGAAVIRGAPTPVLDLGALLGQPPAPVERLVLVRVRGRAVALGVAAVRGVRRLDPAAFERLPALLGGSSAVAALRALDGELVALLDAGRLAPDELLDAAARDASP